MTKINIIHLLLSKIHPMKLTFVKNNLSRISFILALTVVLLWACGGAETKEEATEPVVVEEPVVPIDTTATDTTQVDTTSAPKDPVPIRTPETPQ
jgi:hypothetical protein